MTTQTSQLMMELQNIQNEFESKPVEPQRALQLIAQMKNIFRQLVEIEQRQDGEIAEIEKDLELLKQFVGFSQ